LVFQLNFFYLSEDFGVTYRGKSWLKMIRSSHSGGGAVSLLRKRRRLNGLQKLRFLADIVKDFADNLCDWVIYFFLPFGRKISFIEDKKKDIRRLRKSGIYDNRRFKSLLNSGAQRSAADLGTVTVKKLKTQLAMSKKKTNPETRPAHNMGIAARLAGRWSNGHFIAVVLQSGLDVRCWAFVC